MKIKLYLREWFYNAGIIGFLRILKNANVSTNNIIKQNYIEFDTKDLQRFNEYYFNYFFDIYDISKKMKKKTDDSYEKIKYFFTKNNENTNKEVLEKINERIKSEKKYIKDTIKYQLNKVKNIDEDIYNEMLDKCNEIDKIQKKDDMEKLIEIFNDLNRYFSIDYINNRITLNSFKSMLTNDYFGQPSFLNVVKTKLTYEQQRDLMYKDYISNIIETGYLDDILDNKYKIDEIKEHIKTILDNNLITNEMKKIYSDINKKVIDKQKDIEELKEYIKNNILTSCHICENENVITSEYTESNFIPLAISSENMKNFFWNQNAKFPICDICKLILFCIPAGVTAISKIVKENENGNQVYKEKEIYSFVNYDSSVQALFDFNNSFTSKSKMDKTIHNPYAELIMDIVGREEKVSDWQFQNIFVIEFESEYLAYSRMEYFNINKYVAIFLKNYSQDTLSKIKDYKFKLQIVDYMLKNKDISRIINDRLTDNLKDLKLKEGYSCFLATKVRFYLNLLKKGDKIMDEKKNDHKLYTLYKIGIEIRQELKDKNKSKSNDKNTNENSKENGDENKLTGYVYKMLNSIKANNKKEFMDIVIRLHLFMKKNVSPIFLEVMQDNNLDFESIGHSFISGLISDKIDNVKVNQDKVVDEGGIKNE